MIKIRAVGVTLPAFDPRPGAKLSMCTASSFGRQIQRKRSRSRPDGLANIVDQPLDERPVIPFGHHPDQRLPARLADNQPAAAFELGFGGGDALANTVGLERLRTTV